MAQISGVDN